MLTLVSLASARLDGLDDAYVAAAGSLRIGQLREMLREAGVDFE